MSGINRFGFGGVYVLHSDHEAEVARLRAEVEGLNQALTDALACEQDYLREISELRAEAEKNRVDAERYRWLRSPFATNIESLIGMHCDGELDYQIDKAMGE